MTKVLNDVNRLEILGQEIVCLVSLGKKESVKKILDEMTKKNVVHYLYEKYRDDWFSSLDNYNIEGWEEIFNGYSYLSVESAEYKLGIHNEDDGLLLILFLIFGEVRGFSNAKDLKDQTD